MDLLNSPTAALVIKFVAAFAVVLVLIFAAMWIFRFIRGAGLGIGGSSRSRQPRLAVLDFTDVDSRRRLVLVRRDNVEHLILLGGPTDVVVETNIIRGQAAVPNPARDLDPSLTTTAPTETPQITVPVEPPRTPLRDLARAAANEAPRPASPEAAPTRPTIPGRNLFASLSARREPAAPAISPSAAPPAFEAAEAPKSETPKYEVPKYEVPKAETSKSETPSADLTKAEAPLSDDISAKLDAALRKPLAISPPERRPLPPVPPAAPLRTPAPAVKPAPEPVLETAPPAAPLVDISELESALSAAPQPAAKPPASSPVQSAPPVMPAPPLRNPVFSPPPLRAKPEMTAPSPGSDAGHVATQAPLPAPPPPSAVRGPATPPLTPTERSVFDSLEEEMASLLGRSPKAP